ncbi:MAG: ABC transporter permease [bacterium]
MFRNNLVSVLRSLWKNKTTTVINVVGLTIGITVAIVLLVIIKNEKSFDGFHKDLTSLYRVLIKYDAENGGKQLISERTPSALGENLELDFPELKNRVVVTSDISKIKIGDNLYDETALYADNNFLKNFSFPLIQGNNEDALSEPNSIVLTESLSKKVLGDKDSYLQFIELYGRKYKVTGVAVDPPANSSLQFSALISLSSYSIYNQLKTHWSNNLTTVYINLPRNISKLSFETRLKQFTKKHMEKHSFAIQPFSRIHLYSKTDYGIKSKGNINNLIVYTVFVFFILLTAVINYTNISFNQIDRKLNEIGMRRILGASVFQIFLRSLMESAVICAFAFSFSLMILSYILPNISYLFDRRIEFYLIKNSLFEIAALLAGVSLLIGLLPVAKIVKLSKSRILKKNIISRNSNIPVKGMLALQFSIALFFLITTILVSKQIGFINTSYNINDDDDIILVDNNQGENSDNSKSRLFYNSIAQNNLIKSSAFSGGTGVIDAFYLEMITLNGLSDFCYLDKVSDNYFDMNNIKILSGRSFNTERFQTDTSEAIVVNEAFVKKYDIKNPVGSVVPGENKNYRIIGVAKNFTFLTLRDSITPFMFTPATATSNFLFKVSKQNELAALNLIRNKWKEFFPDRIFSHTFFNESILRNYKDEIVAGKLFVALSIISIFLSLLGVAGLSSLLMIKREKEIAIRKVLGASMNDLILHFSKEFVFVILIGFCLAAVSSYNYLDYFLKEFVYKANIGYFPFVISFFIVSLIVFITITMQSIKSLFANPINSLRSE